MNPYSAYTQARELVDENDKRKVLVAVLGALPEKIEGVKLLIGQKKYEKKFQELTKITHGPGNPRSISRHVLRRAS